jgi:hypothetical protein
MTCAGLMALATAIGIKGELKASNKPAGKGLGKPERDPAVERGFRRLERHLLDDYGGGRGPERGPVFQGPNFHYFVWSLERVGVLYSAERIGQVQWYPWGCERLLATQRPNGSWEGEHGPLINTSFSLLFLNRANIAPELSRALAGKFSGSGMEALRGADALRQYAESRGESAGLASSVEKPAEPPPLPKDLKQASIGQLVAALGGAAEAQKAAADELAQRQPSYADVKDHVAKLWERTGSANPAVAAAARAQVVNAFQRAPMSHCLFWLGSGDAQLAELIGQQVDGRIARADAARLDEYRNVAAAVLKENSFGSGSKEAALDLLVRLKGRSAAILVEALPNLTRDLWPKAGESLKTLTGEDFGPHDGDGAAEVLEAQKRWRAWQEKQKP